MTGKKAHILVGPPHAWVCVWHTSGYQKRSPRSLSGHHHHQLTATSHHAMPCHAKHETFLPIRAISTNCFLSINRSDVEGGTT